MTEVSISVLTDPDPSHPGEAILRLTGVALVPPGSTYRIDPIDDDGPGEPPDGWPSGELKPSAQRITHDGVDLVIGSDVVEAAALLPGTPVTISVPAVGAKAELRWPSLPVAKPARRTAVVVSGEQRAAELAARAAAERSAAARAELEREAAERAAKSKAETAAQAGSAMERRNAEDLDPKSKHENGLSSLSLSPEMPAKARTSPGAGTGEALSTLKPPGGEVKQIAASAGGMPVPPKPAPPKPLAAAPGLAKPAPAAAGAAPTARPLIPAPYPDRSPPAASRSWGMIIAAFLLGGLLVGAGTLLLTSLASRTSPPAAVNPVRNVAEAPPSNRTSAFAAPRLAEILAVPDISPLGQSANTVTLEQALRRADQGLYGADGSSPDRREAKFWLRKALSIGLGDDRLLWAMTQLGTLYAAPDDGAPDYAAARILWELAAAKGDPVALCFLASTFESGLGIAKDTRRALELYEQARSNGGCKGVTDAIARLRKAIP